jgi:hypothetical protein
MESSSPPVPFPLVESTYRPCTIPYRSPSDDPRKATPVEIQWIDLYLKCVPSFKYGPRISAPAAFYTSVSSHSARLLIPFCRQRAESDPTVADAPAKAEKFAQRYVLYDLSL